MKYIKGDMQLEGTLEEIKSLLHEIETIKSTTIIYIPEEGCTLDMEELIDIYKLQAPNI